MGNLNFETSQDSLTGLLSAAGTIVDIHLPIDRMSGRPRGFAFVTYSSDDEAAGAIERFNGHELDGRALRINEAEERQRSGGGGGFRSGPRGGGGGGGGGGYGGGGGGGGGGGAFGKKNKHGKGSRRGLRGKKRSL